MQSSIPFERELIIDLFAGAGGASLGLARANAADLIRLYAREASAA